MQLPKARARAFSSKSQMPLVVSVNKQGRYFLNVSAHPKRALSSERLRLEVVQQLRHYRHRSVLIKGDQHVSYGQVMRVMVLLQKAGVGKVGLMTEAL